MRPIRSILSATVLLTAAFAATVGADTDYTPKKGRFTITLPEGEASGEKVKLVPITLPPGVVVRNPKSKATGKSQVPIESSASKTSDGTIFVGASVGFPAALIKEIPAEKRMGAYRDLIMVPLKGELAEEKDIKQGTWTGKEYRITLPDGKMRMQLYTLGGFGFFAVVQAKSEERLVAKDVDKFFASFKLKDKD